jgi:polysaccharide pyruvyl transferase WcaK-like protein
MKDKTIVVTNIYGTHNLGDNAIRDSGLRLLDEALDEGTLLLLTETTRDFPMKRDLKHTVELEYSPYGFGIETEAAVPRSLADKLVRFVWQVGASSVLAILGLISADVLPRTGQLRYVSWIRNADLIVVMGGGFFMSTHPVTDIFGTVLNVLPLYIAKLYGKKIFVLPISFGPFASAFHEDITGNALRGATVLCRDEISLERVKAYAEHARFVPDMALYDWGAPGARRESYYVLSLREYLKQGQERVEREIADYIRIMAKERHLTCRYVPMGANPIEENDLVVADRLARLVDDPGVFEIVHPKSPDELKGILSKATFSVCNRMHTAILSATVHTPFIAIAYQHKTHGFLKSFGLEGWNIDMDVVTATGLQELTNELLGAKEYASFVTTLEKKRHEIAEERIRLLQGVRDTLGYQSESHT